VVDDALMGITHVIRGDDHLTNTPRQIPIFRELGYAVPQFGHLPMILGTDKARLSKRHGATSILAYKEMGYLPEAMVNYLVRLGWSHGDQEIFTGQELIEKFSLDHVQKSSAVFNPEKLLWVNAEHIKFSEPGRVAALLRPFLDQAGLGAEARTKPAGWLEQLVTLFRERARTLAEMATAATPYIKDELAFDEAAVKKLLTPAIVPALTKLTDHLAGVSDFSQAELEKIFKHLVEEEGMKMGQLAQPVRVALTGGTASPGLFDVMVLLGRERTLARLKKGIALAGSSTPD